tara:strand:+ start:222 stop:1052 length:831 start_codon:yes stop_codon:yes gene_type:complete
MSIVNYGKNQMNRAVPQIKRALILAAGMGSRLSGASGGRPKALTEVNGHSILEWQKCALRRSGIKDEALVTGFKAELLSGLASEEFFNPDFASSNMLWSLVSAREWLDQDLVISYSDILYTYETVEALSSIDGHIVISSDPLWQAKYVGRTEHPVSEAELVEFNSDGQIVSIGKRQKPSLSGHTEEFIGLLRLSREGCRIFLDKFDEALGQCIDGGQEVSESWLTGAYLAEFLTYLIGQGVEVQAASTGSPWMEIDTPQDLCRAEKSWNEPFQLDC